MNLQTTRLALQDLDDCLLWSLKHFGRPAAERYRRLLEHSIREIANSPDLIGSELREEFGDGVLFYHLRNSRKDVVIGGMVVKKPRHFICYRHDAGTVTILRILHDQMDFDLHIQN